VQVTDHQLTDCDRIALGASVFVFVVIGVIVEPFREAQHSYTQAARLHGLHPNDLHRLLRTLDMKAILESDR